jgi:hypothetical protein
VDEIAPCGDPFDDGKEVADLCGFECGSLDPGFVEKDGRIEEAAELEAAAADEHGSYLGRTLLLLIDPGKVGAGFECEYPAAAQRGRRATGYVFAEARPFQGDRA